MRNKGPRIRYGQRRLFQEIDDRRQKTLAIIVHKVLVNAGYTPMPDIVRGEDEKGFGVWVLKSLNGSTSVSVVNNPGLNQEAAQGYARSIIQALSTVIGELRAKQIVKVRQRRLPVRNMVVLDAKGKLADLNYVDVTVEMPADADLRALYAKLGRR